MYKKLLNKVWLQVSLLVAVMSFAFAGTAWGTTTTYQHIFSTKPSTGNNVALTSVNWNIAATNLGGYNSNNYAGVQIGSSKNNGSITLTSSSAWGEQSGTYYGKTKITEVRLWLNLGGTSVTPTVTIGGVSAISDGTTVSKNSSAGTDWTKATKVTFTPATNSNTGVVVIDVQTVKAGYICAMEIDCEEQGGSSLATSDLAITGAPVDLIFDLYNNSAAQTVSYTTSSTGAITVNGGDGYVTTSVSGNKITVTPTAVTPSAQTITVSQEADATYAAGSKTFTVSVTNSDPDIPGTENNPYTVAQALAASPSNGVYVRGIVSSVSSTSVNNNGQIRYYISDDGTESNQLNVYNGKGLNGDPFTSIDDIQVGDIVVVCGDISVYQGSNQLSANNYLVSQITKADPELSYATTEYTVNLGESFTAPILTNPNNLIVVYSVSNNDNIASVNASTGVVTLGENAGTVTITASFAGDDNYRAGSASYTLTVKEPNFIILDAGASVTTTSFPSFSGGSGYKTLANYQIELSSGDSKNWSVTDCMKSGDDLQMKASTGTLVSPDIQTPYGYTVTVNYTSDAAMNLSSGTDSETGTNGSVSLDVQSTEAAFTLKTGNKFATVQSITITAKSATTATITLNAACHDKKGMFFGTYSNTSAFVVSDDIVVAEVGIENDRLNVFEYSTGDIVPANTGVMVSAVAGGDYTVTLSSEAGTSVLGSSNCLRATGNGITAAEMAAADNNCLYYRLTMHNGTEIGYWWGAADGAAFAVAANKAYLAVPTAQAARISGFAFDEENTTTGIDNVNANLNDNKVYDLQGRRVAQPTKGLYIVNGKKVIK